MRYQVLAAVAASLISLSHLPAQQVTAAPGNGPSPVVLDVVVRQGERGQVVPQLKQSDFTVLDNGASQALTAFHGVEAHAQPVNVILVIDAVNVDFQRVAYERQELDRFLRANDGQLPQRTALAIFTDTGTQLENGYTTNGNQLADVLDKQVIGLRSLRRSAGFYGAEERLDLSLKTTGQLLERFSGQPGRTLLIWVTPGWPLISGPGVQLTAKQETSLFREVRQFNAALRRSRTTMYVVDPIGAGASPARTFYYQQFVKGLKKASQAEPGDLGAQVLAVQSGGLFLTGSNDLAAQFKVCYDDASAYYELRYQEPPSEQTSPYHRVEVRMAEPQLKARTLQGYYSADSAETESR